MISFKEAESKMKAFLLRQEEIEIKGNPF